MIRIEIDQQSGFCTGVVKAVKAAEEHLEREGTVYSLGEIVHNSGEVERLREKGLIPIDYEQFSGLKDATVLIRAHGEPPGTFQHAEQNNIRLIDATCPIVLRLQQQIRQQAEEFSKNRGSILIFGKAGHPEVRALVGQTQGRAKVVREKEELEQVKLQPPVALFSQTTMNTFEYARFQHVLKEYMRDQGLDPARDLSIRHSICGQVSSRASKIREFAAGFERVLFVSGKNSSNGRVLFKECKTANPNAFFISTPKEADQILLEGVRSIGICGATSTPMWLLSAIKDRLHERLNIT